MCWFSREKDVYISNTVKCRPLDNRNPLPEEKEAYREFLDEQIRIINPKIMLLRGGVDVQSILGNIGGITRVKEKRFDGKKHGFKHTRIMPIFHPSYLLRNDSRKKGSPKWLM